MFVRCWQTEGSPGRLSCSCVIRGAHMPLQRVRLATLDGLALTELAWDRRAWKQEGQQQR